jgi:DNA-binding MarR family transcriptional regulator
MASDTDAAPSRLMNKPTWLISQTSIHAHRLLTEALSTVNSHGYHYRLLSALEEFGPASQAALGRRTEMDRSDVAAALDALAGRGLVKRTADPHDSRRNVVTITSTGRAQLERLDDVLAQVQGEMLEPLSRRERRTLVDLLARVLAHHAAG